MSPLHILHLEDDRKDAEIIQGVLEGDGLACRITRVETRDGFIAALEEAEFDLILADFSLPSFDGLSALRLAAEKRPDVPFIFVSGMLGEETAIDALKVGATDYVLKQRLSRLASSVRRAMREAGGRAERKQAEQQLQRSEAFLAEGQKISHTGSFGWSVVNGDVYWSEETFDLFEYDRAVKPTLELVFQRMHPDDRDLVRQALDIATNEKTGFDIEHRLLMPDGSVKHLHVIGRASNTSSGNIEYVGAVMDVTEQKLAQAERERLGERLRQAEKMEAVGRLAGGIAHDFNNVLAGILAYGEMLLEEAPTDSSRKRYAQNVLTAATRGRALVEQILAYSRSQRGKRAPTDVCRIVTETLELVRGSLPANIRLDASIPGLPLVVIGDATQLHQVVMNLCSNAIQALSGGGTLRVVLASEDFAGERALSHGRLLPGSYVHLIIEDSGCGMDAATLTRIFEPFFTTKEIGRGTGLGLSLVYAIVTDLAGAIDVKSAVMQGSTFTIYLPLAEVALAAFEAAPERFDVALTGEIIPDPSDRFAR